MFEKREVDVVIVGAGVAGLSAALALTGLDVLVVNKTTFGQGGSTPIAQGGLAAAIGRDDAPKLHTKDTLNAGDGLSAKKAVELLTADGPHQVQRLIDMGAQFDRYQDGELALGREAAHSRRRILHAGGDSTGAEIQRALSVAVKQCNHVKILQNCYVYDLIVNDSEEVVGLKAVDQNGRIQIIFARATILASGGIGRIYRHTTNAVESTADGLAMAARAGAFLSDVEFVQFHPTALNTSIDPLPLLTEALRGEGATLVDETGRRFMVDKHELAELAPRDEVARGIWFEQQNGHKTLLDARCIGDDFKKKFPTVFGLCAAAGLDPRRDLLPITPAAHYHMGGISVDINGRSSLDYLWACGEVAATGVHGANRLASNSLLEGLVFGARVANDIKNRRPAHLPKRPEFSPKIARPHTEFLEGEAAVVDRLRQLMWDHVGLVRNDSGMRLALDQIKAMRKDCEDSQCSLQVRNMLSAAKIVTTAALHRRESRGGHYRSDYPNTNDNPTHYQFVYTGNGPWI